MAMQRPEDRPVVLAAIAGAHGISGEVRLKLFCQSVESLKQHRSFDAGAQVLTLLSVRAGNQGAVARFAELADRTAAEALRGALLSVPRTSLPALPPGDYYWHDLVGLPVQAPDGTALGIVVAVENYGASDLIEVERATGGRVLVPLIPDGATVAGHRVTVDPAWLV